MGMNWIADERCFPAALRVGSAVSPCAHRALGAAGVRSWPGSRARTRSSTGDCRAGIVLDAQGARLTDKSVVGVPQRSGNRVVVRGVLVLLCIVVVTLGAAECL